MTQYPLVQLLWFVFASVAVGGGLLMVTRKNPVASLLFLVLTFFALAAIYVLLGAHFIAAIQIIVYAGAILVLFLFVIMLLNLGHDYRADLRGGLWLMSGFVCSGVIAWLLWRSFRAPGAIVQRGGEHQIAAAVQQNNVVGAIAQPMFRDYLVPFELVGILLLVAIVGSVLLAKRRV